MSNNPTVIYSFGDSLSDAGDAYLLTTSTLASTVSLVPEPVSPPYFQETYGTITADVFTNGPVWVQDLASLYGIATPAPGEVGASADTIKSLLESVGESPTKATLEVKALEAEQGKTGDSNPYLQIIAGVQGGTDFAIGGAVTGPSGYNVGAQTLATDLSSQLLSFESEVPAPSSTALYTVWSGSNDLLNLLSDPNFLTIYSSGSAATDVTESVDNVIAMVGSLAAYGAESILVLDVPNLGVVPEITALGTAISQDATLLSLSFDEQLAGTLAATDFGNATITFEDTYSLIDNAIANPGSYGLTNVTDPVYTGSFTQDNGSIVSTNPSVQDEYLFFDALHPTETGQMLIASQAESLLAASCFSEGTLIATQSGAKPVEALQAGDCVVVRDGVAKVGWIGRRHVQLAGWAQRSLAQPVRIPAGAVGAGMPARDLWLSPEHAVFLDGVLVPARALCGCGSIAVDPALDEVTYYHIALDRHDIVLAEGLACESWLDTGNRAMFENAPVDGAAPSVPCAERVEGGVRLDLIRQGIGGMATQEVELGGAGIHEVTIAPGTGAIRLASAVGKAPGDRRRLGAAVSAVAIDGEKLGLDDARLASGFHAPEGAWRWTDGAALLMVGSGRTLRVEVACVIMPDRLPVSAPMPERRSSIGNGLQPPG
jgi:phospholipase/lecithinase/hemolysin